MNTDRNQEAIVGEVRKKYAAIATDGGSCCGLGSSCGPSEADVAAGIGYSKEEIEAAGADANLGLGCGAPVKHLDLKTGEAVLDLGSGAGIDVFLASDQVGPTGRAIGVDMTHAMIERARANAQARGLTNVEFREGRLEDLPLADASVDAVTSNCVINLVPDKRRVFGEIARVLRPGGRLAVSDIVLDGSLPEALEKSVTAYVGCVAGAARREEYFAWLKDAGFATVDVVRDIDYVETISRVAPDAFDELLREHGVDAKDVLGRVRSVTYRAVKGAAAPGSTGCCAPSCCGN